MRLCSVWDSFDPKYEENRDIALNLGYSLVSTKRLEDENEKISKDQMLNKVNYFKE